MLYNSLTAAIKVCPLKSENEVNKNYGGGFSKDQTCMF